MRKKAVTAPWERHSAGGGMGASLGEKESKPDMKNEAVGEAERRGFRRYSSESKSPSYRDTTCSQE